jgi:prepilin-type processing-associated H-X9-DG protein
LGFTTNANISYDANALVMQPQGYAVVGMGQIESPADVFTFWDAECGWCTSWASPDYYDEFRKGGAYYGGSPTHNGGQNYAYADGHAKWHALSSVPYGDIRWSLH